MSVLTFLFELKEKGEEKEEKRGLLRAELLREGGGKKKNSPLLRFWTFSLEEEEVGKNLLTQCGVTTNWGENILCNWFERNEAF